jgi:hypothetical protein
LGKVDAASLPRYFVPLPINAAGCRVYFPKPSKELNRYIVLYLFSFLDGFLSGMVLLIVSPIVFFMPSGFWKRRCGILPRCFFLPMNAAGCRVYVIPILEYRIKQKRTRKEGDAH